LSPEPIVHKEFLNDTIGGWAYRFVDSITFPMGFVMDDEFVHVSYGRNDKTGWILKLNKTGLLDSLVPVESKIIGTSEYDSASGQIRQNTYKNFTSVKI
jgi:hypothetical protein